MLMSLFFPYPARETCCGRRSGFALIIVLMGLLTITALMTVIMQTLHGTTLRAATDRDLVSANAVNADLIRIALAAKAMDPDLEVLSVGDVTLRMIDVGGLIDLNTGTPGLIELLIEEFGGGPEEMVAYRTWRREGRRLARVEDFARVTGLKSIDITYLKGVSTVHSGRLGIAPDIAPMEVWNIIRKISERSSDLPPHWVTLPSGQMFVVEKIDLEKAATVTIGTGFFSTAGEYRVLDQSY